MDKPGSPDLAAYKKLLDGCAARGVPFQMGFMFRGNPALTKLKELVAAGILGTVLELDMNMSHNYGGDIYQHYVAALPGGAMYNLGCHDIDFIVSLLGAPEKVTAFGRKASPIAPEALNNTMAVLEYEKAIVSIRVNVLKGRGTSYRRLSVAGTNGVFELMPVERFDRELTATLDLKEAKGGFEKGVNQLSFGR
jgi:predicted dehydrogenase